MLTAAEHIENVFGTVPQGSVICPCCKSPVPLFAITRDDQMRWRCGHCRIADEREVETQPYALTWDDVRGLRGLELTRTDWTQLPDAQATMTEDRRGEWAAYRQALRELTSQDCAPADAVWPIAPDAPLPQPE